MKLLFALLFISATALAQPADSLDTYPATSNSGLDVRTHALDSNNEGIALFPHAATLPLNPSGNIPFALTVAGDTWLGDIYCAADSDYLTTIPGAWGCVYGKSVTGNRVGPVVYQVNKNINTDGGTGGPGFILWADRANADTHGNRGYMDIWAWGQNDSGFSNTLNFGNRDSSGNAHRRFRILNTGKINLPDLSGSGNAHLCIDSAGSVYRGSISGC